MRVWRHKSLTGLLELPTAILCSFTTGAELLVDHIVVATGARIDLHRLLVLDAMLLRDIRMNNGMPSLDRHYQSSVPGLFFAGPMATDSFGPAHRFICGVAHQCKMIDRYLTTR